MRSTPYQNDCTLGVLSKTFNMTEVWGLRPDGSIPCLHVKQFKEEKRERFLNAEEFRRLQAEVRLSSAPASRPWMPSSELPARETSTVEIRLN